MLCKGRAMIRTCYTRDEQWWEHVIQGMSNDENVLCKGWAMMRTCYARDEQWWERVMQGMSNDENMLCNPKLPDSPGELLNLNYWLIIGISLLLCKYNDLSAYTCDRFIVCCRFQVCLIGYSGLNLSCCSGGGSRGPWGLNSLYQSKPPYNSITGILLGEFKASLQLHCSTFQLCKLAVMINGCPDVSKDIYSPGLCCPVTAMVFQESCVCIVYQCCFTDVSEVRYLIMTVQSCNMSY